MKKMIWAENLILFTEAVKESNGTVSVISSMTDEDGDMLLTVEYDNLTSYQSDEYENNRKKHTIW